MYYKNFKCRVICFEFGAVIIKNYEEFIRVYGGGGHIGIRSQAVKFKV